MLSDNLPPLREDLQLQAGPSDLNGAPTWTIYDPVRNRYLRLSAFGFEIIRQWQAGPIEALIKRVGQACGRHPKEEEISALIDLLGRNELFHKTGVEGIAQLTKYASAMKVDWHKKLLHSYLFFKIPLIHPEKFLQRTKHRVAIFYQPAFFTFVLLLGALGLFLLLRNWTEFKQTVPNIFSMENVLWGMAALGVSKLVHEFAHAYTAARLNCRVPTMGVAFMVMIPMLYTDMTDTWRLVRRRERLYVAAAGMISELILAVLATLAWTLLPDGGPKDGAFMLATVAWVMTLAINLNPFMRFDGYYIFADALGVENLQDRSFALAKWWMRELFLGLQAPPPERLLPHKRRLLIFYAYCTWLYRFFLFLGIALLVYYMFFKALGLFLFAVEIGYFIVLPVWKELKMWWSLRDRVGLSRPVVRSGAVLLAVLSLLFIPWQHQITAPAVLRASNFTLLFAPAPAQILSQDLQDGKKVSKGQLLGTFQSPELEFEIAQSKRRLEAIRDQLKRTGARQQDTDRLKVIQQQVREEESRLQGLTKQWDKLTLHAPHDGIVRDPSDNLHVGRWVTDQDVLARLVKTDDVEVLAYVGEHEYHRLQQGGVATFISNDFFEKSVDLQIVEVAQVNTTVVEHAGLIEKFGGTLAAKELNRNTYAPTEGVYKVRLKPIEGDVAPLQKTHYGTVTLEASRKSLISRFLETVGSVIIRESGF